MMSPTTLSSILPPSPNPERKGPQLLTPTTNAIPLISGRNGSNYSTLHTVAVMVLFMLQFQSLVADPYRIMLWDLVPLITLQCAYCVACLPPTGTWSSTIGSTGNEATGSGVIKSIKGSGIGSMRRRPVGLGRTGAPGSGGWKGKFTPTVIALMLAFFLPPIPLTVLAHTLGAPLYPAALILHTTVLSIHISLLTCLPLFYTHGVSGPAWRDVVAAWLPFDEAGVWGGSIGCFVGGWLGAIPIALDWDRDWQAWPITVLVGCYGGWAVGKTLLGPVFWKGRRISMSIESEVEARRSDQIPLKGGKKAQ